MTKSIVISSGHGKYVAGASCYIDEVTEARRVVSKVADYFKELSVDVTEYHDNTSRTQSANVNGIVAYHNKQARDLDISVHFNAASKTDAARGVEVLYYSEGDLAAKVSKAIAEASGLKNRGAKKRTDLGFLKRTNKPAILIEVCFVDSKADVAAYEDKFDEICRAIAESVSGKKLAVAKPASAKKYHTIKKGETVSELARKYDTTIAKIKELNELDAKYTIHIGQKLRVK